MSYCDGFTNPCCSHHAMHVYDAGKPCALGWRHPEKPHRQTPLGCQGNWRDSQNIKKLTDKLFWVAKVI